MVGNKVIEQGESIHVDIRIGKFRKHIYLFFHDCGSIEISLDAVKKAMMYDVERSIDRIIKDILFCEANPHIKII